MVFSGMMMSLFTDVVSLQNSASTIVDSLMFPLPFSASLRRLAYELWRLKPPITSPCACVSSGGRTGLGEAALAGC